MGIRIKSETEGNKRRKGGMREEDREGGRERETNGKREERKEGWMDWSRLFQLPVKIQTQTGLRKV